MRPAGLSLMVISKKTFGLGMIQKITNSNEIDMSKLWKNFHFGPPKCSIKMAETDNIHKDEHGVDPWTDLHLNHFLDRLQMEYKMLKTSTRHLLFGLSFIFSVTCVAAGHSPDPVYRLRKALIATMSLDVIEDISFPGSGFRWFNTTLGTRLEASLLVPNITQVSAPVSLAAPLIYGEKHRIVACSDSIPTSSVFNTSHASNLDAEDSCLSESDRVYLNRSDRLCTSVELEPVPAGCLAASQPVSELGKRLLASVAISVVLFTPRITAISKVDISLTDSGGEYSINVLQLPNPDNAQVSLRYVSLICSGLSLLLDFKNWFKKFHRGHGMRYKTYTLFNSFALPSVTILNWIFERHLSNLPDVASEVMTDSAVGITRLDDLIRARHILQILTVVLLSSASLRLVRILSAHPRTSVLTYVALKSRTEVVGFIITVSLIFGYCVAVFTVTHSARPLSVIKWLVPVFFGVWPFEPGNTLLLVMFGIAVFYVMLNWFQIFVNQHFRDFKALPHSPVTQGFVADIIVSLLRFVARMRSKHVWPHRLVILYALERIRDSRPVDQRFSVSFEEFYTEVKRIRSLGKKIESDPEPEFKDQYETTKLHKRKLVAHHVTDKIDEEGILVVWRWYGERFASSFLRPGNRDPTRPSLEERIRKIREHLSQPIPQISSDNHLDRTEVQQLTQRLANLFLSD